MLYAVNFYGVKRNGQKIPRFQNLYVQNVHISIAKWTMTQAIAKAIARDEREDDNKSHIIKVG